MFQETQGGVCVVASKVRALSARHAAPAQKANASKRKRPRAVRYAAQQKCSKPAMPNQQQQYGAVRREGEAQVTLYAANARLVGKGARIGNSAQCAGNGNGSEQVAGAAVPAPAQKRKCHT